MPPPAPMKTKLVFISRVSPVVSLRTETCQPDSISVRSVTRCLRWVSQPFCEPSHAMSLRERAPKLMSVPCSSFVVATDSSFLPSTSRGAQTGGAELRVGAGSVFRLEHTLRLLKVRLGQETPLE